MIAPPESTTASARMRRNVRWNVGGNTAYAVGQWVQLAILARVGGAPAVGAWAYAAALSAPPMMLANMNLRFIQASDARRTYAFAEYRRVRVLFAMAGVAAVMLIGALAGGVYWSLLVPIAAMRAADAISDIYYGLWQQDERMGVCGAGLALASVASGALMLAAATLGMGIPGVACGAMIGSLIALAFVHGRTAVDRTLRAALRPAPVAWTRVRRLALHSAPLGFVVLLASLQQNVPRYFLQWHAGEASLGVFAAASQLTAAGTLVVGALGAAATPRLGALHAAEDSVGFHRLARRLAGVGLGLAVAGVTLSAVAGREVLALLYRPEFASGHGMLVILSAATGVGFVGGLLGYALTAARVIAIQPVLLATSLGVLVTTCHLLVPRHGGAGAAWALLAATSSHAIGSWVVLRRTRLTAPGAAPVAAWPDPVD